MEWIRTHSWDTDLRSKGVVKMAGLCILAPYCMLWLKSAALWILTQLVGSNFLRNHTIMDKYIPMSRILELVQDFAE